MQLQERIVGGVAIIDVVGPMVRDEAEPVVLLTRLQALLGQGRIHILVNVADVAHVDSLWLGALVQGYSSAVRRGGTLKLLHVTRRLRELLTVTRLDRVLESFDTEEAAVASVGPTVVDGRAAS